jgi:hypothetical protein
MYFLSWLNAGLAGKSSPCTVPSSPMPWKSPSLAMTFASLPCDVTTLGLMTSISSC